jgi:L-alanine-DL-glutamate epimerase-like enolase superfamily enzyme
MMLDESIFEPQDIEKAAQLQAAQYIKLKLVKSGGIDPLMADLESITQHGMQRVLGNGVASEIGCWMEACVARSTIVNAGEFNGFLKPRDHIFQTPLCFAEGSIVLPAGYWPALDMSAIQHLSVQQALIHSEV